MFDSNMSEQMNIALVKLLQSKAEISANLAIAAYTKNDNENSQTFSAQSDDYYKIASKLLNPLDIKITSKIVLDLLNE